MIQMVKPWLKQKWMNSMLMLLLKESAWLRQSIVLATWMLCWLLWKNWALKTHKPALIRCQKQPWIWPMKQQSTLPKPWLASTWTTSKTSLRSLTTEQMNMPMTLPVRKAGTTSSGMNSMVNLRSIPIVLQPWRVKKACSQWPLTMASIMEMKMMLPLTRTSWFHTGLKDGGAITSHLHSIWQIRVINSLIPTETGTMF